jgi:16S rRNA (uracil1498-N3)-methyltransferase
MNIPRLFIDTPLEAGKQFPLTSGQLHYLTRVMRLDKSAKLKSQSANFIVFNAGKEFYASLNIENNSHSALCVSQTGRPDPSNNLTLAFAPIRQPRMEEMLNSATQMGVARLQPVITERTAERFPKWDRIKKIIVEASEQSGRCSLPELPPPQKFEEFLQTRDPQSAKRDLVFADERTARSNTNDFRASRFEECTLLIGPEGGFSPAEFAALDAAGAIGISLGRTILRAETAAIVALSFATLHHSSI